MEKLIARESREAFRGETSSRWKRRIEKAKSALTGGILETMQAATQQLEAASHKVAEVLYRATQAAGAAAGQAAPADRTGGRHRSQLAPGRQKPAEGEVIDAEYVDVDESKKPN